MAKIEEKTKAILRYQIKTKSKIENHRIVCDIKKATRVIYYTNIHGNKTGEIYITSNRVLFMRVNNEIFLPHHFDESWAIHVLGNGNSLTDFQNGQEELKDYIAKFAPETYLKFFNDVEEV